MYKPGNLSAPPALVTPHQPRLDWQMWFAALGTHTQAPWFTSLMYRLLQGKRDGMQLLFFLLAFFQLCVFQGCCTSWQSESYTNAHIWCGAVCQALNSSFSPIGCHLLPPSGSLKKMHAANTSAQTVGPS